MKLDKPKLKGDSSSWPITIGDEQPQKEFPKEVHENIPPKTTPNDEKDQSKEDGR